MNDKKSIGSILDCFAVRLKNLKDQIKDAI
jgi:hypothetical protein